MKSDAHHWSCRCRSCRLRIAWIGFANWWKSTVWRRLWVRFTLPGERGTIAAGLEWKLADMWIGIFWRTDRCRYHDNYGHVQAVDVWVCVIPCVPLHVKWSDYCPDPEEVPF